MEPVHARERERGTRPVLVVEPAQRAELVGYERLRPHREPVDARLGPGLEQPGFTVSGFASSVISAPGSSAKFARIARHARVNACGAIADGVPPPKNTLENRTPAAAGARSAASRSSAASQRSTAALERCSFEKWQYGQGAAQNGTCT